MTEAEAHALIEEYTLAVLKLDKATRMSEVREALPEYDRLRKALFEAVHPVRLAELCDGTSECRAARHWPDCDVADGAGLGS